MLDIDANTEKSISMSWNSVVGQGRVKGQLQTIIEQKRLAHAYLFSGPDGVGKDAMALALATVVNCEKQQSESCGKCASCLQAATLQHPNIHLIFALPTGKGETNEDSPLAKLASDDITAIQEELERKRVNLYYDIAVPRANNIKVNSIREMRKQSTLSTLTKGKKVFIIFEAGNLADVSANALLKTLEEPQGNTLIILTTAQADRLKSTIISRCQVVKFEYLKEEEIKNALIERVEISAVNATSTARMANGSYARALQLLDTDFIEMRKLSVDLLRVMLYRPKSILHKEIEQITAGYDKVEIGRLFGLMQSWLHDTMTLTNGNPEILNIDDEEAIKKFSTLHPNTDYRHAFEALERGVSLLHKNVYIPLILLNLAVELHRSIVVPHLKSQT